MFLKGIILGFSIAAPVGPIGLLCIKRTLQFGFLAGVSSGLGTAVADALYSAVAAFGLKAISEFLIDFQIIIRMLGGLFLILLSWKIFSAKNMLNQAKASRKGGVSNFITTFFLTLTNPATIISFTVIFAGLGLTAKHDYQDATLLVSGVFVGSMLWWIILSFFASKMRSQKIIKNAGLINCIAGLILGMFGVWAIATAIKQII